MADGGERMGSDDPVERIADQHMGAVDEFARDGIGTHQLDVQADACQDQRPSRGLRGRSGQAVSEELWRADDRGFDGGWGSEAVCNPAV